jgi:hypothetical protein
MAPAGEFPRYTMSTPILAGGDSELAVSGFVVDVPKPGPAIICAALFHLCPKPLLERQSLLRPKRKRPFPPYF